MVGMSPERHFRLIALLARFDQELAESADLVTDPDLNESERAGVEAFLEFYRESITRLEAVLTAADTR